MESRQDMPDLKMAAAESLVSCLTSGKTESIGPRARVRVYVIQFDNTEYLMSQWEDDIEHNLMTF